MTFLTLLVGKRSIGLFTIYLVIIFILRKMNNKVLYAVKGFTVEEVDCILGCRKMAIHTIGHKPLGIIGMGRCFPCIIGELNFMAECTKARSRSAHRGKVK
jgi:hypothetical protein